MVKILDRKNQIFLTLLLLIFKKYHIQAVAINLAQGTYLQQQISRQYIQHNLAFRS